MGEYGIAGAYLYPYAVKALTGMPACELTNQVLDMKLLMGVGVEAVAEQMSEGVTDGQRVQVFSNFLLKAMRLDHGPDKGLQSCLLQLLRTNGATGIDYMAGMLSVSGRQFERRFTQELGFSPKLFSRIVRFQSTLQHPGKKLTDIAYESGYFDQSHFIREFREFAGFSPKDYFMEEPEEVADSFIKIS